MNRYVYNQLAMPPKLTFEDIVGFIASFPSATKSNLVGEQVRTHIAAILKVEKGKKKNNKEYRALSRKVTELLKERDSPDKAKVRQGANLDRDVRTAQRAENRVLAGTSDETQGPGGAGDSSSSSSDHPELASTAPIGIRSTVTPDSYRSPLRRRVRPNPPVGPNFWSPISTSSDDMRTPTSHRINIPVTPITPVNLPSPGQGLVTPVDVATILRQRRIEYDDANPNHAIRTILEFMGIPKSTVPKKIIKEAMKDKTGDGSYLSIAVNKILQSVGVVSCAVPGDPVPDIENPLPGGGGGDPEHGRDDPRINEGQEPDEKEEAQRAIENKVDIEAQGAMGEGGIMGGNVLPGALLTGGVLAVGGALAARIYGDGGLRNTSTPVNPYGHIPAPPYTRGTMIPGDGTVKVPAPQPLPPPKIDPVTGAVYVIPKPPQARDPGPGPGPKKDQTQEEKQEREQRREQQQEQEQQEQRQEQQGQQGQQDQRQEQQHEQGDNINPPPQNAGQRDNPFFPRNNFMSGQRDGLRARTAKAVRRETQVGSKGGTYRDKEGKQHEFDFSKGDKFLNNFDHDESEATLRPRFGIAGPDMVVPPTKEQLRSDLEFDLFSVVAPGFGEGVDNKLYLYEQGNEKYVRFRGPFFNPGQWLGPLNSYHPMPWQWSSVKSSVDVDEYKSRLQSKQLNAINVISKHGEGSANAFGRDVPEVPTPLSSSGLPRDARSPFEPVIHNKQPWTPEMEAAGVHLNRRGLKRSYSAWRDPDTRERQRDNGGPVLRKKRALEVILP